MTMVVTTMPSEDGQTPGEALLEALDDEQVERLRDGERLTVLVDTREPLPGADDPTSIDVLELTWKTKGVVSADASLREEFDDVDGIEDIDT